MCTSPLYRVPVACRSYRALLPYHQAKIRNKGVLLTLNDVQLYLDFKGFYESDVQILGCGQCAECRLKKSFDWAVRCSLEAEMHEHNYFVTLTYDDLHLPKGEYLDFNGDVWDSNLCRRDIQLFLKNLREWERTQNGNTGIKVFYCGEYGDQNSRPHYHVCLFGCSPIPDLRFAFKNGSFTYYKSTLYEKFWSDKEIDSSIPRGFVDISEVSFDSIAYTARYVMKKQGGVVAKEFYEYYNSLDDALKIPVRSQPFVGYSLRPGIAASYFEAHKDQIYSEDLVKYQRKYKLFCSKPPRYFDKLFDRAAPDVFDRLRRARVRSAQASRYNRLSQVQESEQGRLNRVNDIILSKEKRFRLRS